MKHYKIRVTGDVQGVFYRSGARQKAQELNLNGFARNEPDGSVFIEVEGDHDDLSEFVSWCEEGSAASNVSRVEYQEGDLKKFQEFKIA